LCRRKSNCKETPQFAICAGTIYGFSLFLATDYKLLVNCLQQYVTVQPATGESTVEQWTIMTIMLKDLATVFTNLDFESDDLMIDSINIITMRQFKH